MSYDTLISLATDIGDIDVLVSLYYQLPVEERAQFDAAVPQLAKKYGLPLADDFVTFVRDVYDPHMLKQAMKDIEDLLRYLQEGGSYRAQQVSEQSFFRWSSLDHGRLAYWVLSKAKENPDLEYYIFIKELNYRSADFLEGFVRELEADRDYAALDAFVDILREIDPSNKLTLLDESLWSDYVRYYLERYPYVHNLFAGLEERGISLDKADPGQLVEIIRVILPHPNCSDKMKRELAQEFAKHDDLTSMMEEIPYDYLFFHFVIYFLLTSGKQQDEARALIKEFGYDENFDPFLFERENYWKKLRHVLPQFETEYSESSEESAYEASRSSAEEESSFSEVSEEWSSSDEDEDSGGWEPSYY